jgi:RNA polymerase sigma factor (sigma-70 family)
MGLERHSILGHFYRLAQCGETGALTDAELLHRYRANSDEAAFEALVWRHGGLVLGVCRRLLRREQDAEDAFQATFLAFARAAGTITRAESVGGWLYRVAGRIARKAGAQTARPSGQTLLAGVPTVGDPAAHAAQRDLRAVLDEEVGRLPAKQRVAFVLCYLEGMTNTEAARELGWPAGTVATRLAGARQRLRARLTRRGLTVPVGLATVALGGSTLSTAAPAPLVLATCRSALAFAHGAAIVAYPAVTLARGALRTMVLTRLSLAAAALGAVGLLVTAATAAACQFLADPPTAPPAPQAPAAVAPSPPVSPAGDKGRSEGAGRLLFYRQGHLTLVGPDGKDEKRVSHDRRKFMPGSGRLSPEGKRIAFLVQAEESRPGRDPRRKLYVRGLEEAEPGTDLGIEAQLFSWSPDGKQLAVTDFTSDEASGVQFVSWLVDVATKEKTALKLPNDHLVADWSYDGRYFLTTRIDLAQKEPTTRMYLVPRDGCEERELKAAGKEAYLGRLAPDGGRVLYMAPDPQLQGKERSQRLGLYLLDIGGGKVTRVEDQPLNGELMGYCWSPDGKRIAYTWRQTDAAAGQQTESHLVVADPEGRRSVTIATERGDDPGLITIGDPDWR